MYLGRQKKTCLEHFTSLSHVYLNVCECVCDPDVHAFMSVQIVTVLFCMRMTGEAYFIVHLFSYFNLLYLISGGEYELFKKVFTTFKCIVPVMQDNYSIA